MSRGFLCMLFGIGMTLYAWFSRWIWPAWAAHLTVRILIGTMADFAELPNDKRAVILVLLIVVNSAAWAGAAWIVWWSVQRLTARRRPAEPV